MRNPPSRAAVSCGLLFSIVLIFPVSSPGQQRKRALVCKRAVLAALKPKPELSYPCDAQADEWDEKILKLPARVAAIKTLIAELSSFSDNAWWAADISDLSVCDFTQKVGALTPDQRQSFVGSEYVFWLFGNDLMRLVLIPDPCYQTGYGGSNAFLLHRKGGRVFVTQVLDGYFSRADNSVNIAFAKLNGEQIVEISTGSGGMTPSLTNYYFTIDPRTNHAVPKNLFRDDHGPTNEISSAMLLGDRPTTEPLQIRRGQTLAKTFTIYIYDSSGKIEDSGRTFSRKILRWNGHVYR